MNAPSLRFKADDGSEYPGWEETTLGRTFEFFRPNGLSKDDLTFDGKYKCIHYGHLFTEYGEVIYAVSFLTDKDGFFSKKGDILMPSSDVTPSGLAKASALMLDDVLLGGDINILRPKSFISSEFFSYLINYQKKKILEKVAGTTVKHIYIKDIVNNRYSIPSLPEQKKIADFLSSVDEKITLTDKKLSLMKNYKKGVLQQIFSQKIRFKADDGSEYPEWEEKKIGDILTILHGKDYKAVQSDSGQYPVIGTGGLMTYATDFLCDWDCVLIGRKGTINKPQYMDTPFWTVDTLFYSRPIQGNLPKYQYYLFQTINWLKYNEASGVPSLSGSTVESIGVTVPSFPEQKKIADFLSSVDEKISLIDKELNQLKQYKKALLQQMFV